MDTNKVALNGFKMDLCHRCGYISVFCTCDTSEAIEIARQAIQDYKNGLKNISEI